MWRTLGNVALKNSNLIVAERAFAAIGDITRAVFIRECADNYGKLALLDNDWSAFESGDFNEVIDTYVKLHKWEKAIDFAVRMGRNEVKEDLEQQYYNWLLDSGQQAEAGLIMEKSGKHDDAIRLYMKSGRLVQASKLVLNNVGKRGSEISKSLVEQLISDLISAELYEEVGLIYESSLMNDKSGALDNYIKGRSFTKAIALARKEFPDEVVALELKVKQVQFRFY